MILYFLRHGRAAPAIDGHDAARRLTEEGEDELRSAALMWRRLNLRPDVVLTSPLPRALRTAELFCEGTGVGGRPEVVPTLAPGAAWSAMARAMSAHPDARRVLFVGHEPDLSTAVAELTGASSVRIRTGGIACVEFYGVPEPGGGEIAWLLDPDLYAPEEPTDGAPAGPRRVTRVAAYAVCVDDGRLLLARIAPGYVVGQDGWWTLPGGGLQHGEDPRSGALRELEEETGLIGEIDELLDVDSWTKVLPDRPGGPADYHGIGVLYRCRVVGGALRNEVGGSTDECRWFGTADLPRDRLVDIARLAARRIGLD